MSNPQGINQYTKGGGGKIHSSPRSVSSAAWKKMNKPFGPNNPPAGVSKAAWKKALKLPA